MKAMVGIAVHNEEANIGRLLDFLTTDAPKEVEVIYVVFSGSINNTNEGTY